MLKIGSLTLAIILGASAGISAQVRPTGFAAREAEIRKVEDKERLAVLRKDVHELRNKLWSPNLVVQSPANSIGTVDATVRNITEGRIDYASFDRNIEKITFDGDVAIVMGEEVLQPQRIAPNAGKKVTRRYTNVWKRSKGRWRLIARQATVIRVE